MDSEKTPSAPASGTVDGQAIWLGNNRLTLKATAATKGGLFALWEVLAPPGDSPARRTTADQNQELSSKSGAAGLVCLGPDRRGSWCSSSSGKQP